MTATEERTVTVATVSVTIDGNQVSVAEGTTIFDAAREVGVDIPVLCHNERYDPVGVCRMCVVDTGGRVFAAACVRPCEDGMEVKTATPELDRSRATLTELLVADQPPRAEDPKDITTRDNLLLELGRRLRRGAGDHRAAVRLRPGHRLVQPRHRRQPRRLHPLRPLRAGLRRHPGQRRHRPFRQGLRHPDRLRPERPDGRQLVRHLRRVRAGLPDGCAHQQADPGHPDPPPRRAGRRRQRLPVLRGRLRAHLLRRPRARRDLLRRRAATSPGSQSRLCVKGRYGWDYAASPQRLTTPLIRIDSAYPKGPLSADVRGDGRQRPRPGQRR